MGASGTKEKRPLTRGQKLVEAKIVMLGRGETNMMEIIDHPVRDLGAEMIGSYLQQEDCKCEILSLKRNSIGPAGSSGICQALSANKTVVRLELVENQMGDQLPKADDGVSPASYLAFGTDAADQLAGALKVNRTLKALVLWGNTLGNEGLEALSKALELPCDLQELSVCANQVGDKGAAELARVLEINTGLRKLDLQENGIGDVGGSELASALERSNKTLTELNLRANILTPDVCAQFGHMLLSNTTLLELNLRRNAIRDEGCAALGRALEGNSTLKRLYLSSNLIGDEGCSRLGAMLDKNRGLEEISLEINNIEDAGCIRLAEALEKNSTLLEVDLRMNNFSGQGYSRLAEAVSKNESLRRLELSNSLMDSKEPVRRIEAVLGPRAPKPVPPVPLQFLPGAQDKAPQYDGAGVLGGD